MAFRLGGVWYHTNFKVGDVVTCRTNSFESLYRDRQYTVEAILHGSRVYEDTGNGSYDYIYKQRLNLVGYPSSFTVRDGNFVLYSPSGAHPLPALEQNTPCIVQEISETLSEQSVVTSNVGEPKNFDNLSAARIYCTDQITQSIREKNEYRKFRIYKLDSVAQAKKPEIEFT